MTTAPANLMAVRALLREHLHIEPAALGITGDSAHWGGYHCGRDRVVDGDYSVVESNRDRNGLTLEAAALDVGQFSTRIAGKAHDLRSFSVWLVAHCKANTADSRDIREVIYSADGRTVKRWDRLGRRSSGDSSHLWHTHISFHRDAIKAGRDLTPLFRRYLTEIGLLAGEDDDMTPAQAWVLHVMNYRLEAIKSNKAVINVPAMGDNKAFSEPNLLAVAVGTDRTDEQAIARAVAELLPANTAVSREDLEAALRTVLGSVDGASPAS